MLDLAFLPWGFGVSRSGGSGISGLEFRALVVVWGGVLGLGAVEFYIPHRATSTKCHGTRVPDSFGALHPWGSVFRGFKV